MNERDIPRHKKWTPDQQSSVPKKPWTASEPFKDFIGHVHDDKDQKK